MYDLEQNVKEVLKLELDDKENDDVTSPKIKIAVFSAVEKALRHRTLHENLRVDNRSLDQIRSLYTEVDTAPRAHGSGLFRRGDTQVLSSVTL